MRCLSLIGIDAIWQLICSKKVLSKFALFVDEDHSKVSKGAEIRNRYNQVPHLTQDALS